ncbi:coiled-coil domain-containing protein 7 isoform X3 [Oryctolagus cuniculus]|uniref:coiled-coil domain-containing protein 7 isoform X3 n=1 Tax=Oryctolagus cuniculus TaxID=9986 RepID=UPI00387A77CB
MKPSKNQLATNNDTLPNASEVTNKKRQLDSPSPHQPKEKPSEKLVHNKIEPMVLRSDPPTNESLAQYSLPVPSSKTREFIMNDEKIKAVTKHLEMLVSTLEETYGPRTKKGEEPIEKSDNKELNLSVGDDMNLFLQRCSHLATQLEDAVKEEHNVLDTLFKWFQQQVNQMEEISKDQTPLEELLAPDSAVNSNIAQALKHEQKLEELRNRLKQVSEPMDTENPPKSPMSVRSYEAIEQQIQEAANLETHRLDMMVKMLEKQSYMLGKAMKDRDSLETKCKQMQDDFELLSEEKLMLENELQNLKGTEAEWTMRERQREKGLPLPLVHPPMAAAASALRPAHHADPMAGARKMTSTKQTKMKDVLKVQKEAVALEVENKILQEKLKQALQEAERTKNQLEYLRNQEKCKVSLEMDTTKIKVKDEDTKNIPLKQEKKSVVPVTDEQKISDKIQKHPQISTIQNKESFEERPEQDF